jgi:hypothetical protein
MVSPVRGDHRRFQAEIPLIVLSKFPEPVLEQAGPGGALQIPRSQQLSVVKFEIT